MDNNSPIAVFGVGYIAYMFTMVAIGVLGELTGSQEALWLASTMGVVFIGAMGIVGLTVCGLAVVAIMWLACSSVASGGRALGRWFESSQRSS